MYYRHEPMTEKQCDALHKLIHPTQWGSLRSDMTKEEASSRIQECLTAKEREAADRAYHERFPSYPPPCPSPRPTPEQMDQMNAAALAGSAKPQTESTPGSAPVVAATLAAPVTPEGSTERVTPAVPPKPAPRYSCPPQASYKQFYFEPATDKQKDRLGDMLYGDDWLLIDKMSKQLAWRIIKRWYESGRPYPFELLPSEREEL